MSPFLSAALFLSFNSACAERVHGAHFIFQMQGHLLDIGHCILHKLLLLRFIKTVQNYLHVHHWGEGFILIRLYLLCISVSPVWPPLIFGSQKFSPDSWVSFCLRGWIRSTLLDSGWGSSVFLPWRAASVYPQCPTWVYPNFPPPHSPEHETWWQETPGH